MKCPAAGAVVLAAVLIAGCCGIPDAGEGPEVQEVVSRNVSAAGVAALEVQGTNGGCEVRRGTGEEVSVLATKRTRYGAGELARVSVEVTGGPTLTVRTVHPTPPARVSVDYVILVPPTVGTITVRTSNGGVVADGVPAQIQAETSNGAIRISGIGGGADLRTSNGAITVRGANGVVSATTSNGAITVEDAAGIGDLESSNGRIAADVTAIFSDISIRTSNAPIDLAIGPELDAMIDAEAPGGEVSLPAGLLRLEEQAASRVRGTAGAGGHQVTVRTSGAAIRITAG